LKALGTTPEAVAMNLLGMGFHGKPEECESCPVAHYVLASIEGVRQIDSNQTWVRIADVPGAFEPGDWRVLKPENTILADTPSPVRHFIQRFDSGQFEELNERKEP
jgi:hypothetical protein